MYVVQLQVAGDWTTVESLGEFVSYPAAKKAAETLRANPLHGYPVRVAAQGSDAE